MSSKTHWDGWEVVKESKHFAVLYNPHTNPLKQEEKEHTFHLVYKPYWTIEASANSVILIHEFLEQAEKAWAYEETAPDPLKNVSIN
jgi:hypothetical protein